LIFDIQLFAVAGVYSIFLDKVGGMHGVRADISTEGEKRGYKWLFGEKYLGSGQEAWIICSKVDQGVGMHK